MKNLLYCLLLIFLTSCASNNLNLELRIKAADTIASTSGFSKKLVKGNSFTFTVYERILDKNLPYNFYIEKDGYIATSYSISENPTPIKQMLFKLAALDDKQNVVYIARPCQYTDLMLDPNCATPIYWTKKRLAQEVVLATSEVINSYTNKPFTVVGHSGGGSIAVLIATINKNVKRIITIAANLDIDAFNSFHKVSGSMEGSLNPIDYAQKLNNIPQLHLAGQRDKIVPPFVVKKYVDASGSANVIFKLIPQAEHNTGWETAWYDVLASQFR